MVSENVSIEIEAPKQVIAELFGTEKAADLINVDIYKWSMVGDDEIFHLDEKDLVRAGLLTE